MKNTCQALFALRRLHAEIGGKIIDNRRWTKQLINDRRHVAAVIRMFEPGYDTKTIPARRTYKANKWFKRGTLSRQAVGILRNSAEPLTIREIVDRMLAAKGVTDARIDQIRGMQSAVLATFRNRKGLGIEAVGNGKPARWRLAA
jgi:hypothetical protein